MTATAMLKVRQCRDECVHLTLTSTTQAGRDPTHKHSDTAWVLSAIVLIQESEVFHTKKSLCVFIILNTLIFVFFS